MVFEGWMFFCKSWDRNLIKYLLLRHLGGYKLMKLTLSKSQAPIDPISFVVIVSKNVRCLNPSQLLYTCLFGSLALIFIQDDPIELGS